MASIAFDLQKLYERQFGSKPVVPQESASSEPTPFVIEGKKPENLSASGSALTANYRGQEMWLPVKLFGLDVQKFGNSELLLPYTVIKMSAKKTIIETPMVERQGSVKEQYSIDDYDISLKGFVIGYDKSGKYPVWPEEELLMLKKIFELNESVKLDNALSNIFLGSEARVVIKSLDLPETEAGKKHVRPFSMTIVSDSIFTLELE